MPTVPRAIGPQVAPSAGRFPNMPQVDVSSGHRTIGQGLEAIGADAQAIYERQREDASNIKLNELRNRYLLDKTQFDAGASQNLGKDSLRNVPDWDDWHQQKVSELTADLTPEERMKFMEWSGKQHVTGNRHYVQKSVTEMAKHDAAVFSQGADMHLENTARLIDSFESAGFESVEEQDVAIQNAMTEVGSSLHDRIAAIQEYGNRRGWPEEVIDQRIAEETSKTYYTVVMQHLQNESDITAERVFDAFKDEMLAEDRDHLEGLVKESSSLMQAARLADEAALHDNPIDFIRDNATSIKVSDRAIERYLRAKNIEDRMEQERKNEVLYEAYRQYTEGDADEDEVDNVLLSEIYSDHELSGQWRAMRDRQDNPVNDWSHWSDLLDEMRSDPQKFAEMTKAEFFKAHRSKLDDHHFSKGQGMLDRISAAVSKGQNPAGAISGVLSTQQLMNHYARAVFEEGDERESQFMLNADSLLIDKAKELGLSDVDDIPRDQKEEILRRLTRTQVQVDGQEMPLGSIDPMQLGQLVTLDMTDEYSQELVDAEAMREYRDIIGRQRGTTNQDELNEKARMAAAIETYYGDRGMGMMWAHGDMDSFLVWKTLEQVPDMSAEDQEIIQRYWNERLGQTGDVPDAIMGTAAFYNQTKGRDGVHRFLSRYKKVEERADAAPALRRTINQRSSVQATDAGTRMKEFEDMFGALPDDIDLEDSTIEEREAIWDFYQSLGRMTADERAAFSNIERMGPPR